MEDQFLKVISCCARDGLFFQSSVDLFCRNH